MTRDAIEQVLSKHRRGSMLGVVWWTSFLVDDLLALAPTPSREGLVRILFPGGINDETAKESWLIEKVMAWATGQPPTPVWCEHIRYMDGWKICGLWNTVPKYHLEFHKKDEVWANWTCCPICGTKRPEGG